MLIPTTLTFSTYNHNAHIRLIHQSSGALHVSLCNNLEYGRDGLKNRNFEISVLVGADHVDYTELVLSLKTPMSKLQKGTRIYQSPQSMFVFEPI